MATAADWCDAAGLTSSEQRRYTPCERLRRVKRWSQVRLSAYADVSLSTLQRLEGGKTSQLRVETLVRISMALGCSVLDLMPGFAVRHGRAEGGIVRQPKRLRGGEVQRERVRGWLVEMLRKNGGRMRLPEVLKEFEKYGLSLQYLAKRRVECGILSQRNAGFGNRVDCWEWVLPQPATDAESEARAAPSRRPTP